jgi:hypothetical protein
MAHALGARGEGVLFTLPDELDALLRRSPGVQARTRSLPVGMFLRAEVERIGDPLYGDLRRLAALSGADVAFLPVEIRFAEGAYQVASALLDPRTGRVLWFGIIAGEEGSFENPGTLASTMDALARTLFPWGQGSGAGR